MKDRLQGILNISNHVGIAFGSNQMLDSKSGLEILKYQNKGHLESYENLKDMPAIVKQKKIDY